MKHHRHDERAMVAGAESLAVGCLILVAGAILLTNTWAVIDSRSALDAAAREYLRAWTEAPSADVAQLDAQNALEAVLADRPHLAAAVEIDAPDPRHFGPCAAAAVVVRADIASIRMPFLQTFGTHTVTVRHVELVDAHRETQPGDRFDERFTACADG